MALASKVLPVPGGPWRRIPLGICPPSLLNFSGCLRDSTISVSSPRASSIPATSAKVILLIPMGRSWERFPLPKPEPVPEPDPFPDCDLLKISQPPRIRTTGINDWRKPPMPGSTGSAEISMDLLRSRGISPVRSGEKALKLCPFLFSPVISPPRRWIFWMSPLSRSARKAV